MRIHFRKLLDIFKDSDIKFTLEGKRHLGAAIGSEEYKNNYMKEKIEEWRKEITELSKIAQSQPQAAFAGFIFGEQHKFTYFLRTLKGMEEHLKPLDEAINNELLPALFGGKISANERKLISLPIKLGGLGISIVSEKAEEYYQNSQKCTKALIEIIKEQGDILPDINQVKKAKQEVKIDGEKKLHDGKENILNQIPPECRRTVEEIEKNGTSSWLNVMNECGAPRRPCFFIEKDRI